jgi:hypothetical protein
MTFRFRTPAGALALCALAACGGADQSPSVGSLSVAITDAPFAYDSVARADIFIVRVDAKVAEADSAESERGKGDDSGSRNDDPGKDWVTVATPNASINLLDLQGGKSSNLGQASLPAGTYRGFRLVLDTDKSSVTLKNGTVLSGSTTPGIKWPSSGRSGVKIKLEQPFTVAAGGSQMIIDFDLGHSFILRGKTISKDGLLFKPVIRAAARELTGSVSGSGHATSATGAAVAGATIEVLKAGTAITDTASANVVSTTASNAAGTFKAAFLMPGSYSLRVTPPAASAALKAALVPSVAVTSGKDTPAGAVVLP